MEVLAAEIAMFSPRQRSSAARSVKQLNRSGEFGLNAQEQASDQGG